MARTERRTAAAVLASLAALLVAAPAPSAALAQLAGAWSSSDPTGPLVACTALGAWAVTAWLALTVAVVLLSRVPGLVGRSGAALARRVAPAAVRQTVEAALGLTVAVAVLAPTSALALPTAGPSTGLDPTAEAAWDLDWPGSSTPPPVAPARPSATATPTRAAPTTTPPAVPPRVTAAAAPVPTSVPPRPARVQPPHAAPTAGAVVVRVGDNLWSLAEASLREAGTACPTDRQVAQAWPRWWAANRAVIGDDPDLLLPGTVLRPPPGAADPR